MTKVNQDDTSKIKCIGIDLGTTNSCIGIWENDSVTIIKNEFGHSTTPSVVYFPKKGDPVVGRNAVARLGRAPSRTIYGAKRLLGQMFEERWAKHFNYQIICDEKGKSQIRLSDQTLYPEQVSSNVLKKMKTIAENYIGEKINRAVITVPAYFSDSQRYATRVAAELAGLTVSRIINEPTAACLCYGIDRLDHDCHVLVYDCGGGTLDVSLLSMSGGLFEVVATSGDCELGGIDFDNALVDYFIKERVSPQITLTSSQMNRLREGCEQLKIQLSSGDQASYLLENFFAGAGPDVDNSEDDIENCDLNLEITLGQWNLIVEPIVIRARQPVLQVLEDSRVERDEIEQIVLVGGSTRVRALQDMLLDLFPGKKLNKSINPDEAVAYGATIQSAILGIKGDESKVKEMVLVDVTPLSLGIEIEGGLMSVIVPRNTSIPCIKKAYYTTTENNQTEVMVEIFQGERPLTRENKTLGRFYLTDIPPAVRGIPKIRVEFAINADGLLNISAIDEISGVKQRVVIDSSTTRVSAEEIERMVKDAEDKRVEDENRRQEITERQKLEESLKELRRVLEDRKNEVTDELFKQLRLNLNYFEAELKTKNGGSESVLNDLIEFGTKIENQLYPKFNQLFKHENDSAGEKEENERDTGELNEYLATIFQ